MSDLKTTVSEFFNNNNKVAESFFEYNYKLSRDWSDSDPYKDRELPFEYRAKESFGGEGQGDNYWNVIEVRLPGTEETTFVKFVGWYSSYDGAYYDSFQFVEPKEKVITIYE